MQPAHTTGPRAIMLLLIALCPVLSVLGMAGAASTIPSAALSIIGGGVALWLLWRRFRARENNAPFTLPISAALLFACTVFLSSLSAADPRMPLLTVGRDAFLLAVLAWISSQLFKTPREVKALHGAFLTGALLGAVLSFFHLVFNGALSSSFLSSSGSPWYFAAALFSLLSLSRSWSGSQGAVLSSGAAAVLLAAFLVSASTGEIVLLALLLFLVFVFLVVSYPSGKRSLSLPVMALGILCFSFMLPLAPLRARLSPPEVSSPDTAVMLRMASANPVRLLMGTGPGTLRETALHTLSWQESQLFRRDTLPSSLAGFLVTDGLLAVVSLLLFIAVSCWKFSMVLIRTRNVRLLLLGAASLCVALGYLLIQDLGLGIALFALAVAVPLPDQQSEETQPATPLSSLYGSVACVILFIVYVGSSFFLAREVYADFSLQKVVRIAATGETAAALPYAARAAALSWSDEPLRVYASLLLADARRIESNAGADSHTIRYDLQRDFDMAAALSQQAIDRNSADYRNWEVAGQAAVQEDRLSPQADVHNAAWLYNNALARDPNNPNLLYARALVALRAHDTETARRFANEALARDPADAEAAALLRSL